MSYILVVAEKPSVGRDIAKILHCTQKGEGFLKGEQYIVTWAFGHLVALKDPEELDPSLKKWSASALPILPDSIGLKILPKTKTQFRLIQKLMKDPDITSLVCATDAGREGELIFRYIYQMAGCTKPFSRLWISSLTDEAIQKGFSSLQDGSRYDALYESAKCRSEADWLIGMNATRAYSLRYGVLLSVGRVQTPTLQMLVTRRKQIDSFVPEDYYTLKANFGTYEGTWINPLRENDSHIDTLSRAEAIAAKVRSKPAVVTKNTAEDKCELPPQLFDLTSLQRACNQYFGMTAKKTLDIAQALYEKQKLITYPRTDSRYLSDDMKPPVRQLFQKLPEPFHEIAAPALSSPMFSSKRIFDNGKLTDHHAIIPTSKHADLSKLSEPEKKVYDLIVRHLIMAFYPGYRYSSRQILTVSEGETFLSTGIRVLDPGFKAISASAFLKSEKKADKTELPDLPVGFTSTVRKIKISCEQTKPPKEYTDSTLLSAMEHAGRDVPEEEIQNVMKGFSLGTPATRAAIIERLITVGYAVRKGKTISATEKGVHFIEVAPEEIASPLITGKWEYALEKIALGTGDSRRFLAGIRNMTAFLVDYAASKAPPSSFEPEDRRGKTRRKPVSNLDIPCPLCRHGHITENSKAFSCSEWKKGCPFTVWKDCAVRNGGPEMTAKLLQALLASPDGTLKGSTGVLHYSEGRVSFAPNVKEK